MGLIRSHLWVPDGQPKEPGGDRRDGGILKRWLTKRTPEEISTAIIGFASLRDSGALQSWCPPGTKVSLRALALPANGGIRFFEVCISAGLRKASPKRGEKAQSLGQILRKAMEA